MAKMMQEDAPGGAILAVVNYLKRKSQSIQRAAILTDLFGRTRACRV